VSTIEEIKCLLGISIRASMGVLPDGR
jgi:hypothetical protein